jgi:SAM-dependent methyltransferase
MEAVLARAVVDPSPRWDVLFDRVFPARQRFRSWLHWTPVDVALRAIGLLAPSAGEWVLDVGAGVGKFCLIGAATTNAAWFGIERDAEMVGTARHTAAALGLAGRTQFHQGDIADLDWRMFHAFYLFNPFGEILFIGPDDALARREKYNKHVESVQRQLAAVAPGTRVVTYHGFGGDFPPGFEMVGCEPIRDSELCLWIRTSSRRKRRAS